MKKLIKFPLDNFSLFSYVCLILLGISINEFYNAGQLYGLSFEEFYDWFYDGFYLIVRFMITTLSGLILYKEYKNNTESRWLIPFGIIALIFNPIKLVKLDVNIWLIVDLITICLIALYLFFLNKKKNNLSC